MTRVLAERASLFGRDYLLSVDGTRIGSFRAMSPAGHGRIRIGSQEWSARREGIFRGAWNLFGPGDERAVMTARRPSAFRNSVIVTADDTEWEIHLGSFGNRITLSQEAEIGSGRTTWSSRQVYLDVPEQWPKLWMAFSLWLAVWLSRRRGGAAAAGGS